MNLRKKIEVRPYFILAKYKFKTENAPMLAILKAAYELEPITPDVLCEELLSPLPVRACSNLLLRLEQMGYLEKQDNDWEYEYVLTDLGNNAVRSNTIHEEREGVLKIYFTDTNDFVLQKIIKVQELGKDIRDYENQKATVENLSRNILNIAATNEIFNLNNGQFIIDEIETKGIIGNPEKEDLEVVIDDKGARTKALSYEDRDEYWTKEKVKKEVLINQYAHNYISSKDIVKVPFEESNLMLLREEIIKNPIVKNTNFDQIKLNLNLSPRDENDARKWYLELLKNKISNRDYFFTEDEFKDNANSLAKEFVLFEKDLKNKFSRKSLLNEFTQDEDFYVRAKLETIDYLNY